MPAAVEVRKVPIHSVSDASELTRLIDDGVLEAGRVIAIIGKTEGNGGVNDYTRILADRAFREALVAKGAPAEPGQPDPGRMQVLILTIIVDGAGQLAPDRYSLFWGYYETVFKRERDKQGGLHHMLREYGQQIQLLHERVGFELQVRSESGDRSFATLTPDELKQITWQVLDEAGFKPSGKDGHLLDSIFVAATQRLVLIAPRGVDGYGFDVRSLQELMAAMQLTTGPLTEVIERLRRAAASPHWRNTWIFAAGRLFAIPQSHQHEAVVNLVESVDEGADDRLGNIAPIGPRLALEVIDDGMARSLPKWRERLIAQGLRVLSEPMAAVPGLHFHDLRHTGNTLAAATGVSTRDLMARMGHDSMNAAIIYQHATREADRVIADGLDARLGVLREPAKKVVPDPDKGESGGLTGSEVARELHDGRF